MPACAEPQFPCRKHHCDTRRNWGSAQHCPSRQSEHMVLLAALPFLLPGNQQFLASRRAVLRLPLCQTWVSGVAGPLEGRSAGSENGTHIWTDRTLCLSRHDILKQREITSKGLTLLISVWFVHGLLFPQVSQAECLWVLELSVSSELKQPAPPDCCRCIYRKIN